MLEFVYNKIKKIARTIDMKLERAKYGYIEKLPKGFKYFEGGLYDLVYESSCKWPHNVAIQYFDTEITYKEMIKKINKIAAALKAIGIEKGDRVAVCMPNTPEEACMFYAINEVGAVAVMIHPLSSEKEIEEYLNQANPRVMLCIDITYPKVEAIMKDTSLEQVIVVSATRSMDLLVRILYKLTKGRKNHIKKSQYVTTWDKFLSQSSKFVGNPHTRVDSNDPAVILYTGGTTGRPKGVLLTNMNFNAQAMGAKFLVPEILKTKYTMISFLPNFHAFGLGCCMHMPFYCGMRIVLIPQFNAKKLKSYIKKYKINILVGVPAVFEYLMKLKFGPKELKVVKAAVSGGDVVSQAAKEEVNEFLKAHGSTAILQNGYGLTEAAGGVIFSPAKIADGADVIGYPLPDSEVLVLDINTGKKVAAGEDGELLVRGLTVMKEYINNPKETEAAFTTYGNKKYLKTGDICNVDERGIVHFKARLKRMIITNGYNVYPSIVEEATKKCKAVAQCACIGVPDKIRGERVKIFVVARESASERAIRKDLAKVYKQYLAKYEIPRDIAFIKELPKTKLNKVDFVALQNL